MLRISGGNLKGSKVIIPKGDRFRPTLAKSREAMFNVINSRYHLSKYTAVDLFAGSGILGFEALSRGIPNAVFIDTDQQTVSLIRKNINNLSLQKRTTLVSGNAIQWIKKQHFKQSRYLFLSDPPYQTTLAQEILILFSQLSGIPNGSLLITETHKEKTLVPPENLDHFQHKSYGITNLDFFEINKQENL